MNSEEKIENLQGKIEQQQKEINAWKTIYASSYEMAEKKDVIEVVKRKKGKPTVLNVNGRRFVYDPKG